MSSAISISYKAPFIPGGKLERSLPASWGEMDPAIVWRCIELIMQAAAPRLLVRETLDIPDIVFRQIDRGQMYDLIRCIDWMQVDPKETRPVATYIDHKSKGGTTRLYLPADRFGNVTGMEYALLDDLYEQFKVDQNSDIEAQMIALVLRPEGATQDPASDPRIKLLSREQTHDWLPAVRALPDGIRFYLTTLISANRLYIYEAYKHWLFTETPVATDEEQTVEPESDGLNLGWWGLFMDIAQDGIFGDYEKVQHTPIHDICMHQSRKVEQMRKEKQAHDHALARAGVS